MKKSTSKLQMPTIVFSAAAMLALFAILSFALPSVTFQSPTLSDNATTGLNWVFVNVTSSEDLNQSLLEWGNSSGFTNVSMTNVSGMTNWYQNMTGLVDGTYNYTVWAENTTGGWNQTERRFVYIDTTAPYSLYACQDLTIENGSYVLAQNVSSAGTCFTIKAKNIILDGQGYSINYSRSVTGYAINNSDNNNGYDNVTIKNLNIVQGNASVQNSNAIYAYGMSNSNITNNTITTSGSGASGIVLISSNSNTFTDNIVTTTGSTSYGIWFSSGSSGNNNILGGSIISQLSYSYHSQGSGATNNFTNTNFTASRKISLTSAADWFNYRNDSSNNIWLKTSISKTWQSLTRTLVNWNNTLMQWSDTNSTSNLTATYNITGLLPSTQYNVYNNSGGVQTRTYNLTTDASGNLPSFTIDLNGNTMIKVQQPAVPSYSLNSTNSTFAGKPVMHSLLWQDNDGLSYAIFSFDNCTGSFQNITGMSLSGISVWSNFTATINSTVGCTIRWKIYANDTDGNLTESAVYSYTTTLAPDNPPTYSNVGTNSTVANQSTKFYAYWTDDNGLSGFIFSTNNSGGWQNETWLPMTGTGNWSNYTVTLNITAGLSIGYRFYANDTSGNWSDTGVSTVSTIILPQVSFISPTPVNDTNQTWGSLTINVSINVTNPDKLIFNWNGTNTTYNYSETSWNTTKRGNFQTAYEETVTTYILAPPLKDGLYTYYVWINDTNGNSNQTETRTITINGTNGIQALIDALPETGGIVTLENREYTINSTVYVDKDNIVIQGTKSSILKNYNDGDSNHVFLIPASPRHNNITFAGFNITSTYVWAPYFPAAIRIYNATNIAVRNVESTHGRAFIIINTQSADVLAENITISDNIYSQTIQPLYSKYVYIINNSGTNAMIDVNRNNEYIYVYNNNLTGGTSIPNMVLKFYASSYLYAINNSFDAAGYTQNGIAIWAGPHHVLVKNNTIKGATLSGIDIKPQFALENITITNNIIYNNNASGILTWQYDSGVPSNPDFSVNITNNVIFNNTGDGIRETSGNVTLYVKNNIIVNNSGHGVYNLSNNNSVYSYNLIWGNANGSYYNITPTEGNISVDPLFANASAYDFHLKSQAGRWNGTAWVNDSVTSPAIDAGDPSDNYSLEPEPNGDRINMGAYGGTREASKTYSVDASLSISFVDPTPPNGNTTTNNYVYINTTITNSSNTTAFIDFNRSLVGWWRFNNETGENSTFFRDWSSWGNNGTLYNRPLA